MLVILTERQVLSTKQVCSNCLMADSGGLPRWRQGKLSCGRLLNNPRTDLDIPKNQVYECQMGFRVTDID